MQQDPLVDLLRQNLATYRRFAVEIRQLQARIARAELPPNKPGHATRLRGYFLGVLGDRHAAHVRVSRTIAQIRFNQANPPADCPHFGTRETCDPVHCAEILFFQCLAQQKPAVAPAQAQCSHPNLSRIMANGQPTSIVFCPDCRASGGGKLITDIQY